MFWIVCACVCSGVRERREGRSVCEFSADLTHEHASVVVAVCADGPRRWSDAPCNETEGRVFGIRSGSLSGSCASKCYDFRQLKVVKRTKATARVRFCRSLAGLARIERTQRAYIKARESET